MTDTLSDTADKPVPSGTAVDPVCGMTVDPEAGIVYAGIEDPTDDYYGGGRPGNDLFGDSVVALGLNDGKLKWYYQELPGDDWDADHNQERILAKVKLRPDPKHVKWIADDVKKGEEREVVMTVAEGGGMFVVDRDTGKFIWAKPFPFDIPDFNISKVDTKTGQTHVNVDKLFKADGDARIGCFHNSKCRESRLLNAFKFVQHAYLQLTCFQIN